MALRASLIQARSLLIQARSASKGIRGGGTRTSPAFALAFAFPVAASFQLAESGLRPASESPPEPQPVSKRLEPGQTLPILHPIGRHFARDDVVDVADRKAFHDHPSPPRILKPLDAIGSKDEVEVEGPIFQLDEVLAGTNLPGLGVVDREADLTKGGNERFAVAG